MVVLDASGARSDLVQCTAPTTLSIQAAVRFSRTLAAANSTAFSLSTSQFMSSSVFVQGQGGLSPYFRDEVQHRVGHVNTVMAGLTMQARWRYSSRIHASIQNSMNTCVRLRKLWMPGGIACWRCRQEPAKPCRCCLSL